MNKREKIFKDTWKTRGKIRRGIAAMLIITMLPFSSFAPMGTAEVYAGSMTEKAAGSQAGGPEGKTTGDPTGCIAGEEAENLSGEVQVSANSSAGISMEEEASEDVKTHGGEEIDAFINAFIQGEMLYEKEDLTLGESYVLQEDMVVNNLILEGGKLDLKGHTLYVCGDFIQTGGTLEIGDGRVAVCKDYQISGEGTFTMTGENGYLLVMGNFSTESLIQTNRIYLGVMEVKGDFVQYAPESPQNFFTLGIGSDKDFTLYLTGNKGQRLFMEQSGFNNSSLIANLIIENESEEGVTLENNPCVWEQITTNGSAVAGNLGIGHKTVFTEDYFDGGIIVPSGMSVYIKAPLTVGKGLLVSQNSHLSLYDRLEVLGDAQIEGSVHVYENGLNVKGDVHIENEAGNLNCGLNMTKEEAYVLVEGDFYQKISMPYHLTGGILECQGNVTLDGPFGAEEKHKVVLSGAKEQRINLLNGASFQILELENHSSEGIVVDGRGAWNRLVSNGCKISVQEVVSETGYILEEDETISTDFVLNGGILDLNGHTLTVSGNFLHSGGRVVIGDGKLIVEGDYRFQSRSGEEIGGYHYGGSEGTLKMTEPLPRAICL